MTATKNPVPAALRTFVAASHPLRTAAAVLAPDGVLVAVNPALERMLGASVTREPVAALSVLVRLDPELEPVWCTVLASDPRVTIAVERAGVVVHLGPREEGFRTVLVEELPGGPRIGLDSDGSVNRAYQDPLTGLGNRRLLTETLAGWESRPTRDEDRALLVIDLDRFKQVNDTLGHAVGDRLLQRVAQRINSTLRTEDQVMRMGGDEFVVLQHRGPQPEAATTVAARIAELVDRPFLVEGHQINVGASVGVATLNGLSTPGQLLRHADLALYAAKNAGRGGVRVFEPELEDRANRRRDLEIRLRRALALRELTVVYQPQVDIVDGTIQGFEALLRWTSHEVGAIGPDVFIPLAEELGEIHSIGEWVLRQACAEAMTWDDGLRVAVNVSPVQFERAGFAATVAEVLATSGLPPHRLEIEITEGVLLSNTEAALAQLWAIQSQGVHVAMDDFGTGYSSLSHLNSFPFSSIKIDQSFVRGEPTHRSRSLVDAIIGLGATLGIRTVIEGVETVEQLDRVTGKGPLEIQGYLVSRPMSPEDIDGFVASHEPHTRPTSGPGPHPHVPLEEARA